MYKLVPLDYSSFPWLEIFCVWKPQFIIIVKSSAWVWIVSEGLRHATRSICFNCFLKTNILNKLWFFSIFNHFLCCSFRSQSLSVILLQVPLRHMKKVSRLIHFCFIFSSAPKSFKESRGCFQLMLKKSKMCILLYMFFVVQYHSTYAISIWYEAFFVELSMFAWQIWHL